MQNFSVFVVLSVCGPGCVQRRQTSVRHLFRVLKVVNCARQSACLIKPLNSKVCSGGPDDGTGMKQPRARRCGETAYCVVKGETEEGFEQRCAGMKEAGKRRGVCSESKGSSLCSHSKCKAELFTPCSFLQGCGTSKCAVDGQRVDNPRVAPGDAAQPSPAAGCIYSSC